MQEREPGWRWLINKFATKAHFMRAIATMILTIAAYQALAVGKVDDTWLALVGMVIGYYFKGGECTHDHEAEKAD